jgi:tRNA (guanosine-2'-O-)-methyltransferase
MTPEREEKIIRVIDKRQPDITVVFENVHDPHNISAVMRTCDAVGIKEIYVLYTQEAKLTKLGKKSSSSALKWLEVNYFYDTKECFDAVRKKYNKIYSTRLTEQSHSLYDLKLDESIALVFGNERDGVSDLASSLSDGNFIIPQVGMIQSLNISVACAVTLYEAFRQRQVAGRFNAAQLNEVERAAMIEKWKNKS